MAARNIIRMIPAPLRKCHARRYELLYCAVLYLLCVRLSSELGVSLAVSPGKEGKGESYD